MSSAFCHHSRCGQLIRCARSLRKQLDTTSGHLSIAYVAGDSKSNSSDDSLRALLTSARSIALVSASSKGEHSVRDAIKILLSAGFRVILVSSDDTDIGGLRPHPSLGSILDPVDIVVVFRGPIDAPSIVKEAVTIGAKTMWLQPDIMSDDVAARALDAGLSVVVDRSIGRTVIDLGIVQRSLASSDDRVDEAGKQSFPASDPPPWSRVRPGGPRDLSSS